MNNAMNIENMSLVRSDERLENLLKYKYQVK